MPAYIIVEVTVHNPTEYEDYKKLTPGSLKNFQGKFIVRGGKTESLEGEWNPQRIVVLEFQPQHKPGAGGLRKNTHLRKLYVSEPPTPK
ncbi:MAG: DUF1330 domain-containing protein [Cytophagales bacterium]|nr:DUF1330 domain-containing protein [Cytophagales bacterium]